MGGAQATNNKSEVSVTLVDQSEREEKTSVIAARIKRDLEQKLVAADVTTVSVGLVGVEAAPLQMTITGNSFEEALAYAKAAEQCVQLLVEIPTINFELEIMNMISILFLMKPQETI